MTRTRTESWATSAGVARSMRSNRGRDTGPELAIRRLLHARGLRYRVDIAPLKEAPRKRADIVFPRRHLAVFIDGCFWHGCPQHATFPVANRGYWGPKLQRNKERDRETDRELAEHGWQVIRVWEHEDPGEAAERIAAALSVRDIREVEGSASTRKNRNGV